MKVRTDFVTNSSSSSFIAIIKKDYENEEFTDPVINALVEHAIRKIKYDGVSIFNEETITEFLLNEYNYDTQLQMMVDEKAREQFKQYTDFINNGYEIFNLQSIDDCDSLHNLLSSISNSGSKNLIVNYLDN